MSDEIATWPDQLQAALDASSGPLIRVTVLRKTDSTQDAARWMRADPGDVIVAARQVRGRGRMGSRWSDTSSHGIAMTFVLPREAGERLVFCSAVATAIAAEALLDGAIKVGIKWPNDVYAWGKKLAGILIEQLGDVAHVGIGMNVSQTNWPDELAYRAISLAELGANVTRLEAMRALANAMNEVLVWPNERLAKAYHQHHLLRDQVAEFHVDTERCIGRVIGVCIDRGLKIQTEDGARWLLAAKTRVIRDSLPDRVVGLDFK